MFWKLIREPFHRPHSRRRALWAIFAVALGTAVAAAMLSVSLDVGDRVGNELRSLGANIIISPAADSLPVEMDGIDYRPVSEGAYISEASLPKLKNIFWRNNVLAFAPYIYVPARAENDSAIIPTTLVGTWFDYPLTLDKNEQFRTGIHALNPTWKLEGSLPYEGDSQDVAASATAGGAPDTAETAAAETAGAVIAVIDDALVGNSLATKLSLRPGNTLTLSLTSPADSDASRTLRISGILTTGGAEDDQIFAPLHQVQSWAGLPDKVRKVQLSALIKPEDDLSRKGPARMTPVEYDRWYCSPYISSILHQIGEALPGTTSRAVRQVAETQGNVLGKLTFLMGLLAFVALLAASLSISSLASLTVLERRNEIGLMKALGAGNGMVAGLFLSEMAMQGLCGGLIGFVGGQALAKALGNIVFGAEVQIHWPVLPAMALVGLAVSLAGTLPPVWRAVREDPARVLRSV